MAPRVLVMSASVGAGHLRAAQAVELALKQVVPDATVKNLDVLSMTNAAFRRVYAKAYLDLIHRAPHVLGYFYDMLDRPPGKMGDKFRLLLQKLNLGKFLTFLKTEPFDLVINTHFLPAEIVASLRKDGKLSVKQVTATTDFDTHRLWVNQPCDRYFTATEEGALYLHSWGVPAEDIFITGIPVDPVFSVDKDRDALVKKHGLGGDRPIVLQMAGGFGVGPIEQLYRAILAVDKGLEVIVVCGRNEAVKKDLEAVPVPERHRAKIMGFTTDVDELMALADLIVTKPGGLTTSEALARGCRMVIVNPTPGQEDRNSDFLLENGAAIKVNNVATLAHKVSALLKNEERMIQLRANALRLGRPRAAFDVVRRSLELLK